MPDQWCQAIRVTDAVLQHGDARPWAAELLQPWRAGWRVVRLGAQQNPVARLCSVGIGQGANWNLDRAFRALDDEPLDGASETGDDIVAIDRAEQSGDDTADAAEADDGNARSLWTLSIIA